MFGSEPGGAAEHRVLICPTGVLVTVVVVEAACSDRVLAALCGNLPNVSIRQLIPSSPALPFHC